VLASLNSARDKGTDASIKANLANMRAQAELFYDDNANVYTGVCADPNVAAAQTAAETAGGNGGACADAATTWVSWAGLKGTATDAWCVDNAGESKQITIPGGAITSCP
jgi:hypothetical protein